MIHETKFEKTRNWSKNQLHSWVNLTTSSTPLTSLATVISGWFCYFSSFFGVLSHLRLNESMDQKRSGGGRWKKERRRVVVTRDPDDERRRRGDKLKKERKNFPFETRILQTKEWMSDWLRISFSLSLSISVASDDAFSPLISSPECAGNEPKRRDTSGRQDRQRTWNDSVSGPREKLKKMIHKSCIMTDHTGVKQDMSSVRMSLYKTHLPSSSFFVRQESRIKNFTIFYLLSCSPINRLPHFFLYWSTNLITLTERMLLSFETQTNSEKVMEREREGNTYLTKTYF